MRRRVILSLTLVSIAACVLTAFADYTVVLKNGRRITAQSYREDAETIKLFSQGGEISIGRDQIASITRTDTSEGAGLRTAPAEPAPTPATREPAAQPRQQTSPAPEQTPASAEQKAAEQRTKEEKEYQQKIKGLTDQLRDLRERYSADTRGNKGREPAFFTTEEAFKGHQDDLLSRLRDAQNRAQGLPTGDESGSPPFALNPPPAYSEKQQELSERRRQIKDVETQRNRLIEEMKMKNFDTGSLFLD